jgi:hypothetical protein
MKTIRCLRKVLHDGELYLKKGETASVSDSQAARLIAAKHVEEVKSAEKGGR